MVGGKSSGRSGAPLAEIREDEERLEKLFKSLDVDGNGRIDIHDLSSALRDTGVHHTYAKVRLGRPT